MPWSPESLLAAIRTGESKNFDLKAPCAWNDQTRVGLAKDIAAFANTRDGGTIVLGVDDGTRVILGVSPEQASSFDPTPIGQYLKRHFDPPVSLSVGRLIIEDKEVVFLEVREFEQAPVVCVRDLADSHNAKKALEGDLLVRTAAAQSQRASPTELRELIGRSVAKNSDYLLEQFRHVLQGAVTAGTPISWREAFAAELQKWREIEGAFQAKTPYGTYSFIAAFPKADAPLSVPALEAVVSQSRVVIRGRVYPLSGSLERFNDRVESASPPPSLGRPTASRWAVFRSGLFADVCTLAEDSFWGQNGASSNVVAIGDLPITVAAFILFASRLAQELGRMGTMTFEITLARVKGRQLTTAQARGGYAISTMNWSPSAEETIRVERSIDVALLAGSGWKDVAVELSDELVAVFGAGGRLVKWFREEIDSFFSTR